MRNYASLVRATAFDRSSLVLELPANQIQGRTAAAPETEAHPAICSNRGHVNLLPARKYFTSAPLMRGDDRTAWINMKCH
jgi:hypothetical protein